MNKQFILVKTPNGEALVAVEQIKNVEHYAESRQGCINLIDGTSISTITTALEISQMIKEAMRTPEATPTNGSNMLSAEDRTELIEILKRHSGRVTTRKK